MRRAIAAMTLVILLAAALCAQHPISGGPPEHEKLLGPAEKSGFRSTSTHSEIGRFLDALRASPGGSFVHRMPFGASEEGRPLEFVAFDLLDVVDSQVSAKTLGELGQRLASRGLVRVLVQANIHGGEVEGKEVTMILLRELAEGRHPELRKNLIIGFVPLYNADGNDAIHPKNRVSQNGPIDGVGLRENVNGLDLNRDFVKVESSEARSLLSLYRAFDPHIMLDLHTTNGSEHGYHLTYSSCLSPNQDPDLRRFAEKVQMPAIRKEVYGNHLFRTHDYGNYRRSDLMKGWQTFDHRPRFATNYYGLRNRFAVLSEAYSYQTFEVRVRATRAFVLENLRFAAKNAAMIKKLCADADARCEGRALPAPDFPSATQLEAGSMGEVLVAKLDQVKVEELGTRRVVTPGFERLKMNRRLRFEAQARTALPHAWVVTENIDAVAKDLDRHGVIYKRHAGPHEGVFRTFTVTSSQRAQRPFQKHKVVRIEGQWAQGTGQPKGPALVVPGRQKLARVAAQLLEPQSEDSLTVWNRFDAALFDDAGKSKLKAAHPVWRQEKP